MLQLLFSYLIPTAESRKRGLKPAGLNKAADRADSAEPTRAGRERESSKPLIRRARFKRRIGAPLAVRGGSGRGQMGCCGKCGRSGTTKPVLARMIRVLIFYYICYL